MRIVLDSNVICAAFATRGLCNELFELLTQNHDVYCSSYILEECRAFFTAKLKMKQSEIEPIIQYIQLVTKIVTPTKIEPRIIKDEYDLPILGTAKSAKATILVTGDKELLNLVKFGVCHILSPRDFWNLVTQAT